MTVSNRLDKLEKRLGATRDVYSATESELWRAALPGVDPSTVDREATAEHWQHHRASFAREYIDTTGAVRQGNP